MGASSGVEYVLRLHFVGGSTPEIIKTEFGTDGHLIEWRPNRIQRPALDALLAVAVTRLLGDDGRLRDQQAVEQLCRAISNLRKLEFKWPDFMLGDRDLLPRIVTFADLHGVPSARLDGVAPERIAIVLDDKRVNHDSRILERMLSGLLERVAGKKPGAPADRGPTELARAIRLSLGSAVRNASIAVAEADGHVPRMAAARVMEIIRRYDRVTVGLSGGLLQQLMIYELGWPGHRRGWVGSVRIVALNRMRWNDWRFDRSAEFLSFEMAKLFSSAIGGGVDIVLPPLPGLVRQQAEYERAVASCGLLVLSGGSPSSSFVSDYLSLFGQTLPADVVGDLAGHPIDQVGSEIANGSLRTRLDPLGCLPLPAQLRAIVAEERARVMLIADGVPGHDTSPEAKGRVVRAALLGGLVNEVVIPRGLAGIVAGEPSPPQAPPSGRGRNGRRMPPRKDDAHGADSLHP